MSFSRLLHPVPAGCRSYSSFFSSKPGGGRYFNSAKPPKSIVSTALTKSKGVQSHNTNTNNIDLQPLSVAGADAAAAKQVAVNTSNAEQASHPNAYPPGSSHHDTSRPSQPRPIQLPLSHPVIKSKDFKLHQFFSMHRPLLLLADPPSILRSAPESWLSESPTASPARNSQREAPPETELDPEAAYAADADTARQMTHTLTMNRLGEAVEWEETLRRLGLDVSDAQTVELASQICLEWNEVMMDSTKRKKRKKMKKHKLRKRRRALRQRIKK